MNNSGGPGSLLSLLHLVMSVGGLIQHTDDNLQERKPSLIHLDTRLINLACNMQHIIVIVNTLTHLPFVLYNKPLPFYLFQNLSFATILSCPSIVIIIIVRAPIQPLIQHEATTTPKCYHFGNLLSIAYVYRVFQDEYII